MIYNNISCVSLYVGEKSYISQLACHVVPLKCHVTPFGGNPRDRNTYFFHVNSAKVSLLPQPKIFEKLHEKSSVIFRRNFRDFSQTHYTRILSRSLRKFHQSSTKLPRLLQPKILGKKSREKFGGFQEKFSRFFSDTLHENSITFVT